MSASFCMSVTLSLILRPLNSWSGDEIAKEVSFIILELLFVVEHVWSHSE